MLTLKYILEQYVYPKNRWFNIDNSKLSDDKELKDNLLRLIRVAYKEIGGHIKIENNPDKLYDYSFKRALDYDNDNDIDVFIFGKKYKSYVKTSGVGHDGTYKSKKLYLDLLAKNIQNGKMFSASSKALAHILIKRYSLPYIDNKLDAEKILNKKVIWLGEHPEGKYPDYNGWFYIDILGKKEIKILFGKLN